MSPSNVPDIQILSSVTEEIFFSATGKKKSLEWKAKFISLEGWVNLKNTVNFVHIKNLIEVMFIDIEYYSQYIK